MLQYSLMRTKLLLYTLTRKELFSTCKMIMLLYQITFGYGKQLVNI